MHASTTPGDGVSPVGASTACPASVSAYRASPWVVLACIDCDHVYEATAADLAAGHTGCPDPDCGGWVWSSALTAAPAAGGGS